MTLRDENGWQLILADLALILFLVTIGALAGTADEDVEKRSSKDEDGREWVSDAEHERSPTGATIAPAQALYRPGPGRPAFEQWLESQTTDPRATLSVIALHRDGDEQPAWENAQALAQTARQRGLVVRVVVQPGEQADLYASLAFDTRR